MSANKAKKASRNATKSKDSSQVNATAPKDPEFEKAVIKEIESSRLRVKPWVLQLIGAVFIIIGLSFIIYPFLSDRLSLPKLPNLSAVIDSNEENTPEENTEEQDRAREENQRNEEEGRIAEGLAARRDTATTPVAKSKSIANSERITTSGNWRATNYAKGEITPGEYEVKLGDTLWEISEAVYGDGGQWQKIVDGNSSEIGFLANGTQALLTEGQILIII